MLNVLWWNVGIESLKRKHIWLLELWSCTSATDCLSSVTAINLLRFGIARMRFRLNPWLDRVGRVCSTLQVGLWVIFHYCEQLDFVAGLRGKFEVRWTVGYHQFWVTLCLLWMQKMEPAGDGKYVLDFLTDKVSVGKYKLKLQVGYCAAFILFDSAHYFQSL